MISKNQIKFINTLKQKKFREEHQLFIAEGTKIVLELLESGIKVNQVFGTQGFFSKTKINNSIECMEIKANEMERISALTNSSEVLAICEIPNYQLDIGFLRHELTLVLDDIRDPGNLGTIIRISDWFGISNIICSNNTADSFNSKVIQASMGSIARVKVHYTDLITFFKKLTAEKIFLPVFGALLQGENIYSKNLTPEGFIVIGNESKGISEALLPFITDKINIPSFVHLKPGNAVESLNAAIAAAVICSEFRRR